METQDSIDKWGLQTFGEHSALSTATRMNVEVAELLHDLGGDYNDPLIKELLEANIRIAEALSVRANALVPQPANPLLGKECADVGVVLAQVASRCYIDLQHDIDAKMAVNRNRSWAKTEGGRYQHT